MLDSSFASSIFMEICGEEEHLTVVPGYLKGSMNQKLAQMIGHNRAAKKDLLTFQTIPISFLIDR